MYDTNRVTHSSDSRKNLHTLHITAHPFDVDAAKHYLAGIEGLARTGRTSHDPRELAAVLQILARPSQYLKQIAEVLRAASQAEPSMPALGHEPFNLSPDELERARRRQ